MKIKYLVPKEYLLHVEDRNKHSDQSHDLQVKTLDHNALVKMRAPMPIPTSPIGSPGPGKGSLLQPDTSLIPKYLRGKADWLLKQLLNNGVRWTENLALISSAGVVIENSNILSLINDALRARKTVDAPVGWYEFARILHRLNIPIEVIGNPRSRLGLSQEHNTPAGPHSSQIGVDTSVTPGSVSFHRAISSLARKKIKRLRSRTAVTKSPVRLSGRKSISVKRRKQPREGAYLSLADGV